MFAWALAKSLKKRFVNKKRFEDSKEELCSNIFVLNLTNVFVQKYPWSVLQEMIREKKVLNLKEKIIFCESDRYFRK